MSTITEFDPAKAGFRVADGPIERKPRTPSSRPQPEPKYAKAVWFSFSESTEDEPRPLEMEVPTRATADVVRQLKQAARYLQRTKGVEVRVQIGVEPVMVQAKENGELVFEKGKAVMVPAKPAKSTVKFLGHPPWALGRRIAKLAAEAEPEQPAPATRPRHRRTAAVTRGGHRKASLRPGPPLRAVISAGTTLVSGFAPEARVVSFHPSFPLLTDDTLFVIATIVFSRYDALTLSRSAEGFAGSQWGRG